MSQAPTPQDVRRAERGLQLDPSDGPSGDKRVDEALELVIVETRRFSETRSSDAAAVVEAGSRLHDILQQRLGEAQT